MTIEQGSQSFWEQLVSDAERAVCEEPVLKYFYQRAVLDYHSFEVAFAGWLSSTIDCQGFSCHQLRDIMEIAIADDHGIIEAAIVDLEASFERNPAYPNRLTPFLYFKGFQSVALYRIGHWLWMRGRKHLALHIQSRVSEVFQVDIHPAARIGRGIFIDHATGVVIGETTVIDNDVSILQGVTLGGIGKEIGDRHPKIRRGVMLGTGAKVLGNIEVGEGAKVGAGSVVLKPVPPHVTVAGVPARIVAGPTPIFAGLAMDQSLPDYAI